MDTPYIRIEDTGDVIELAGEVTTVGRGRFVDVRLEDPTVSRLHAEIVRRGPFVYVTDLGLSRNGTRVNGRPIGRRVLEDGDIITFGSARCRVGGIPADESGDDEEVRRPAAPEVTRRELDVLAALCKPAMSDEAFVMPATAREIASDLVVTEAAIKQHLLRLYQKFHIPEGPNRRTRLANEVISLGMVRPFEPTALAPQAVTGRALSAPSPAGPARAGGPAAQAARSAAGRSGLASRYLTGATALR